MVRGDGEKATQEGGIIDRAPDTDALSDGCAKPEVETEVVALTLEPPSKTVFVTSTKHNGNFGGLSGADGFCQGLANAAGLGGAYMAWLGDPPLRVQSRPGGGASLPRLLLVKPDCTFDELLDGLCGHG